jgi:primosomal protein N' (replication factor Y)
VSQPLREALANTIAQGHQAMLFLNRRGYAPLVLCRTCGHRFQCPECSTWLVMHKSKSRLECHHCNFHMPMPDTCPACNTKDNLHACGPGVERIHEEVKTFLPEARVAVMASDSMTTYKELSETIHAMLDKKIDLLIGTQMIAKGHHFADLGAVGVVDADLGLAGGDLRASERTYQLLHQLSGRAGRETVRGKVYLQSYLPEHPVMQALISGDREAFLATELEARKNANMPPFSRLAAIIVDGAREEEVIKAAHLLSSAHRHPPTVRLLGPAPAPLYRLSNRYRMRLLFKAERSVNLPDYLRDWVSQVKIPSAIRVRVDIDPVSFL